MTLINPNEPPPRRRMAGDLAGAGRLMNAAVFIGAHPGLTRAMKCLVAWRKPSPMFLLAR
jgi:hypothetical protein